MKQIASVAALAALATSGTALAQRRNPTAKRPVAAAPAKQAPKVVPSFYYDFKGAMLGMALEEWTAVEMPIEIPINTQLNFPNFSRNVEPDRIWCS